MIYFAYLTLLFFCALQFDFSNKRRKSKTAQNWFFICFVIITLIAGLRYNIGADTLDYASDYGSFPQLGSHNLFDAKRYQPGWMLLEATFRTLSSDFIYLQFFVALFVNCVFFNFIWKNSNYPFIAVVAYFVINFFEFDTEILRESVAIGLGLLMYSQIQRKKTVTALILLVLAFYIHVSSAILLLLFVLSRIPLKKVSLLVSIIICIFASGIWESNPQWSSLLDYIVYKDTNLTTIYFENFEVGQWNFFGLFFHYLKFLIIPCVFLLLAIKNNTHKYSLIIVGYMLFGVLSHNSNAFLRASNYFAPFYWLLVADAAQSAYENIRFLRNKFIITTSIILIFIGLYEGLRLKYEDNVPGYRYVYERYFPYKSVLEPGNSYSITPN